MTVLALEPDPGQAATIRHIVCQVARAELALVHSKDEALQALHAGTPDLILLPALCSPTDEAELLAHLRTLPDGAYVETLMTPLLCAPDDRTPVAPRGWRKWRARGKSSPRAGASDPRVFAEQLTSSLLRAREARQQHLERRRPQGETGAAETTALVAITRTAQDPQPSRAEPVGVPAVEPPPALLEGREAEAGERNAPPFFKDPNHMELSPSEDASGLQGLTVERIEARAGLPARVVTEPSTDVCHQRRLLEGTVSDDTGPSPSPTLVHQLLPDRRAHRRFPARELQRLRAARIKYGPLVSIVDLSVGGALLESEIALRPGSEGVLELAGETRDAVVPFRVVRSLVASLEGRLLYWGACAFTRPLELADLMLSRSPAAGHSTIDHLDRFDIALKTIVEQDVSVVHGDSESLNSLRPSQTAELVKSLQEVSSLRQFLPAARSIDDLLAVVTSAFQRSDGSAVSLTAIEEQLREALPGLTARFAAAPASIPVPDTEAIYFQVPNPSGSAPCVLSVELPQGSMLEEWQFRLLKASAYFAGLLRTTPQVGASVAVDGDDRRRHIREKGPFDGRWLGAIERPVVIHDLSEGECLVHSLHEVENGRQLTLEIHVPEEGWMTLKAEVAYSQPEFGFAVRFTEMPEETRACLARIVAKREGSVGKSDDA